MSTHKSIDKICVAVTAIALIITILFMNGASLGIKAVIDEDAELNSDSEYFTANDQNADWDTSNATVITLNGDSASVKGKGAYAYDGGAVINYTGYYVLRGTLSDGSITVDAKDYSKVWILLDGVTINCSDDACIIVDQADKVFLTLAEGTENTLTSGAEYSEAALSDNTDGAIFAHDDLTINGTGSLTVTAEYKHGIAANDDLVIIGGTINVTSARDAIRANDSMRIKDAAITVNAQDDGIVVSKENSYLYIESGSFNITSADDAVHTAGDITVAGGNFEINAGDDAIHSDTNIAISDGNILISSCYEGIEAVTIDVSGGNIEIYPTDDGFNANGGSGGFGNFGGGNMPTAPNNSGDSTDTDTESGTQSGFPQFNGEMPDMSNMPTPPNMGGDSTDTDTESGTQSGFPQFDGEMSDMSNMPTPPNMGGDGTDTDTESGSAQFDGEMPDNSGDTADTTGQDTWIRISGGNIKIVNEQAMDADGLDSNGSVYITGGNVFISLANSGPSNAIDFGSESGGVCEISGGTLIAAGSYTMAESFDSSSTQCSIMYTVSDGVAAGTVVSLVDADGNEVIGAEIPATFSCIILSSPDIQLGETYTLIMGDSEDEITVEEVSASYGDAQSTMFGGNMFFGGMGQRQGGKSDGDSSSRPTPPNMGDGSTMPDFSQMTPPDGTTTEDGTTAESGTETESGTEAEDGDSSRPTPPNMGDGSSMPDFSQMTPPEGTTTESGTETESGDSSRPTPPDGGFPDQQSGQESEADADDTDDSEPQVTSMSWILTGASVLLLTVGIVIAALFKSKNIW